MLPIYIEDEVETNINMDNKDRIILSCDTLGTTVPETLRNDGGEKVSHYNNYEGSSEHVQSSECVNYYDNESYVLEHLKTELPEDVLPQSDCSVNTQIHSENKELLEVVVKTEIKDENTEDELSSNIKQENYYNEHQFTVKSERPEEQEDVQQEIYHNTLNNGCNLLQNSNKHIEVEINTQMDYGVTELYQCQYCGKGFDNYSNMLVHISTDHKQEKSRCDICGKQFKSVGNLKRHILGVHKVNKPLEPAIENCVHCRVKFQHKFPLNDYSKLSCSGKEDGEDEGENKETRNIMNYDYGTMLECRCDKQYRSPIQLREHQKLTHRVKIPKTNNERFQCDSCKNFFASKWSLDRHVKSMHFDYGRKFECWCGKEFRSPIYLHRHERLIHLRNVENTNNGNFQCDFCKAFFQHKHNLIVHIQRLHFVYEKQFNCWCGKQYRSPLHLREHQRNVHRPKIPKRNERFQCDSCKSVFTTKWSLTRHIKSMHFVYGRKFECWCGKEFRSPLHLQTHETVVHKRNVQNTNSGKFECEYCNIFFKEKSNLLLHIKRVHYDYGKRFDCWCGQQFRSPIQLRIHEKRVHRHNFQNSNNAKFQCDSCKMFFTIKQNLIRHIKAVHCDYGRKFDCWCGKRFSSPLRLQIHESRIHKLDVQNTNNSKFQCDYCKISFKQKSNLWLHIRRVHYDYGKRFNCWCGKKFRSPIHLHEHQRNTHRPKVPKRNEKFQCDSCKNSFATRCSLVRHIKGVHFDYGRKFDCWCGKQFRSPLHLHSHERVMHKRNVENDRFQCDYCKYFFNKKSNLVLHIKSLHYDYGKRFSCSCGKQYRSPIQLRKHQKLIHQPKIPKTNNERIQCDFCKKSFTTKWGLTTHIKSVHLDYGRMFECWCGKEFRTPLHLQTHQTLIHKRNVENTNNDKFQCDYCKIFYKSKMYLSIHIKRVHYDYGKLFACWCGKQFRSPIDVRGHERRVHRRKAQNTNNTKFQCDYCKMFFTVKQYLVKHIKAVHYDYGKLFACWCGKQFRLPKYLRLHERRIHKGNVQNTTNS